MTDDFAPFLMLPMRFTRETLICVVELAAHVVVEARPEA